MGELVQRTVCSTHFSRGKGQCHGTFLSLHSSRAHYLFSVASAVFEYSGGTSFMKRGTILTSVTCV